MKFVSIIAVCAAGLCVPVEAFSSPNAVAETPVSQTVSGIDQLLTESLLSSSTASIHVGGLTTASNGVQIWRRALSKGRAPTEYDFAATNEPWPPEPLHSAVCEKIFELELPRFASRHPETITSILLSLIRITIEYMETTSPLNVAEEPIEAEGDESHEIHDNIQNEIDNVQKFDSFLLEDAEVDLEEIAEEISSEFFDEWNGVVGGVGILDQLFGFDHGLLKVGADSDFGPANSFGLQDGIWQDTGWKVIKELQAEISNMPQLTDFLQVIGRRPTVENSDKMQLFSPRKPKADGSMGAQFDPIEKDFMNGLTHSDSFSEMLPSEAMLLRGSHPVLRRLFLAKKVQSKLLSYEMSGWADVPSIPRTKPLYTKRLPSAPGGPITLCLDTSYSMEGRREALSKAVVLACVSQAHKQGRRCQVVAFSNERDVMEAGDITADAAGIQRLLEFLSHGFGGGTDATGALKHVMKTIDNDEMADADIVLISDGEIPDPPIPLDLMTQLDSLTLRRGVQIHGLLVGKQESIPLSKICSETYDFLFEYESMAQFGVSRPRDHALFSTPQQSFRMGRLERTRDFFRLRRTQTRSGALAAKRSRYDDDGGRRTKKRKKKFDEEEDDYYDNEWDDEEMEALPPTSPKSSSGTGHTYLDEVSKAVQALNGQAKSFVDSNKWTEERLIQERNDEKSCWSYLPKLNDSIDMIGEGLVERQDESRLVVLSMLANEHILLLGVPGTGKSVLGRRLARLCNGRFFQRLLTRFTTPDELFGPLSLQALENDEYRRCTSGFLPTATVAFLDEIFKANSAILNTLLTILNERKFDNAGGQEDCPIRCVVGASNELPESDELVALYDRFLIRKEVTPVSDEGVMDLLSMRNPGTTPCDSTDESSCDTLISSELDEITENLATAASSVVIEDHVSRVIIGLRTHLRDELSVQISDRRLLKAAQLLRLSAASHGRQKVDTVDCLLLQHCMWQLPEQKKSVTEWLLENLTPGSDMQQFRFLLENLRKEIQTAVRKTSGDISGDFGAREADLAVIQALRSETEKIVDLLSRQYDDLLRHIQLLQDTSPFLWIDPEELVSAKQLMLPRAQALSSEVERILIDAKSLQLAITEGSDSVSAEQRVSVIEELWDAEAALGIQFTEQELEMDGRDAKAKYDLETFRKWKRAKKKAQK